MVAGILSAEAALTAVVLAERYMGEIT
jgi:hypothetical protein